MLLKVKKKACKTNVAVNFANASSETEFKGLKRKDTEKINF